MSYSNSPSDIYRIYEDDNYRLYIKSDHLHEAAKFKFLEIEVNNTKTVKKGKSEVKYIPVRFKFKYNNKQKIENDCLLFAEGLTCGKHGHEEPILMEMNTQIALGNKHAQDQNIAKQLEENIEKYGNTINENANPDVGQSYGIVRKDKTNVGEMPYHIAHVLFKDSDMNVTLEANASTAEDKTVEYPEFGMYYVNNQKKIDSTFHRQFLEEGYDDSVTMVLVPRNIRLNKNAYARKKVQKSSKLVKKHERPVAKKTVKNHEINNPRIEDTPKPRSRSRSPSNNTDMETNSSTSRSRYPSNVSISRSRSRSKSPSNNTDMETNNSMSRSRSRSRSRSETGFFSKFIKLIGLRR
jgi:hypothetical protein